MGNSPRVCTPTQSPPPEAAAKRAGMDAKNLAGHSMRSGMATQASMNGAGEREIAKTTGHRSRRVLRRYIRTVSCFARIPSRRSASTGCTARRLLYAEAGAAFQ